MLVLSALDVINGGTAESIAIPKLLIAISKYTSVITLWPSLMHAREAKQVGHFVKKFLKLTD